MQEPMSFQQSVIAGLRIEGSEQSVEGVRHRRRYRWAANQLAKTGARVIVDHGCGSGHGTQIMYDRLVHHLATPLPQPFVCGYDPDEEAAAYARLHFRVPAWSQPPFAWDLWTSAPREHRAVVTHGVLEHIPHAHPSDMLALFLKQAKYVVGFFPYKEPAGHNPHHFWHDLGLEVFADLPSHVSSSLWFEPAGSTEDNRIDRPDEDTFFTSENYLTPLPNYFLTSDPRGLINVLFVLEG